MTQYMSIRECTVDHTWPLNKHRERTVSSIYWSECNTCTQPIPVIKPGEGLISVNRADKLDKKNERRRNGRKDLSESLRLGITRQQATANRIVKMRREEEGNTRGRLPTCTHRINRHCPDCKEGKLKIERDRKRNAGILKDG